MKKIIQYLIMLMVSLAATSCYYDKLPPAVVIPIPATVSFANDVQPLLNESCIACHKAGATSPDLTAANSYASLTTNSKYVVAGSVDNSILHKVLIGVGAPQMPTAGKLSDSKIAIIDKWINAGALNN
jgi:mono/diheme cytochrome c family protein